MSITCAPPALTDASPALTYALPALTYASHAHHFPPTPTLQGVFTYFRELVHNFYAPCSPLCVSCSHLRAACSHLCTTCPQPFADPHFAQCFCLLPRDRPQLVRPLHSLMHQLSLTRRLLSLIHHMPTTFRRPPTLHSAFADFRELVSTTCAPPALTYAAPALTFMRCLLSLMRHMLTVSRRHLFCTVFSPASESSVSTTGAPPALTYDRLLPLARRLLSLMRHLSTAFRQPPLCAVFFCRLPRVRIHDVCAPCSHLCVAALTYGPPALTYAPHVHNFPPTPTLHSVLGNFREPVSTTRASPAVLCAACSHLCATRPQLLADPTLHSVFTYFRELVPLLVRPLLSLRGTTCPHLGATYK